MKHKHLLGILSTINADSDLSENNVIEKIKEKLEKEDPEAYEEWQNNEFDINYPFDDRTLLHIAATHGLIEITKTLILAEADINAATEYGLTPLHLAAHLGHVEIANILIEGGANVNASNENGRTILYCWCQQLPHRNSECSHRKRR